MKKLSSLDCMLVVRTDFGDQPAWEAARAAIGEPEDEYGYHDDYDHGLEYVDDESYRDATAAQLLRVVAEDYQASLIAVVDAVTLASPELPVLLMDLNEHNGEYGRQMRVIPSQLPSVEVNVSIGNMDFFEFADSTGPDGIFRGFR